MAKTKTPGSVPNRHLYSRLSYLHQAAAFLGSQVGNTHNPKSKPSPSNRLENGTPPVDTPKYSAPDQLRLNLARHLLTDLRATSLKSQLRLSPAIKHTICKFCDTLLIEGETSTSIVENKSKGCKKPWADVLVVKCNTCNGVRRFPVQAPRQKRRSQREQLLANASKDSIKGDETGYKKTDIVIKMTE
ncbi:RNAse P Rpr2/Rpp21/SNM1 subunit domain-containing protein [Nemania sp. FL0031]|nr:RNAse P Rpr2/Rpp21/SNM1 subunit domain-containing protein [Nemania sp. FL0031]